MLFFVSKAAVIADNQAFFRRVFLCIVLLFLTACSGNIFDGDDLTQAQDAYAERNFPLAERLLERYLRLEQNSEDRWPAWNLLLSSINSDRAHPRASLDCLDAMVMEYENDSQKLLHIYPEIGKYCEMIRAYEKAAEAWNSYLELGDIDDEQRINGLRKLAAMQFAQKHYQAAENTLQQCLAMPEPENAKIYCMLDLAENNMILDNWEEVGNLAQEILDSKPDKEIYGKASFLLGDAYEQLGKPEDALAVFEQAKDIYPNPLVIENRIEHLKKKNTK